MKFVALALLCLPAVLCAQVDPSGTWRTLHSAHFRIHFRPEHRALAAQAAAEAERAYALLATELRAPRGIVDVTLADDVDTPNGFASTFPSNRITILLVPPVSDPGLRDYDSWQRLVIVHELTHVFHLDRTRRWWRALQSVFGRLPGTFPNQYQPSWVTEGIATYYESRFTAAGRADGGFHRQIVAADRLHGNARSPWDALYFTRWPNGMAPYAYGSRFWEYLSHARADSLVPRFVEKSAGQLIPVRVGRPLRFAGADLEREWRDAVVATALGGGSAEPATSRRIVAGSLRSQPVPRVAPDGKHIAYLHDDGRGARRLRVIDPAVGSDLVLRSHRVTGQVSYDWQGDTLIVAQLELSGRWQVRSDLWSWTPPPENAWRRLTTGGRFIEPRTGAGDVVTALQLTPGDNGPTLLGSMTALPDTAGTTWGAAVPSPDGQWVAASRHRDGRWQLVRWRAESPDDVEILASPAGGVSDPSWSGSDVLFVSDIDGLPQVLRWSNGVVVQLTSEPLGARAPAALADGTLLFTTLGRDGWELRAVQPPTAPRAVAGMARHAAFDSAPPVPVRESGYAEWPSLRPHFWIPLAFNAGDAGFFVGAATAGGDAVGRHAYFAEALVAPSPLRAQGAFALVSHALGDPTLDFYVANDWSVAGIDTTGPDHVFTSNHAEASVGATVLARRWFSFVTMRLAADYEGRWYRVSPDTTLTDICPGCAHRDRVGGTASLSFGSAVGAPLAMSPQDGFTAAFLYKRREEQGTSRWLNEVRGRLALYGRLGPPIGFAYPVLALRLAAGSFDGTIVERLSVGGVSSGAIELPFGQSLGTQRSFPVRGYRAGTLRGRRAATASIEYRVPLALIGRSLGHLPFGADKLGFTLFADMGDAWNPGGEPRFHRLRSAGVELVGDLTVSYDLPLRVRGGVAWPHGRRPAAYVAFASDF